MKANWYNASPKLSTPNPFVKLCFMGIGCHEKPGHGIRAAGGAAASVVTYWTMEKQVPGTGKSSFDLVDARKLFERLSLEKASTFIDLGCGHGEYAIEAALHIGEKGTVYAIDVWEAGLGALSTEAEFRGLPQLKAIAADICATLPFQDQSIDVCFAATVLHDLVREGCADRTLEEARRILRPRGILAIVEFKKFDGHPGPPIDVKLSPDQVEQIVAAHGFTRKEFTEIGPYNYLITFDPPVTRNK